MNVISKLVHGLHRVRELTGDGFSGLFSKDGNMILNADMEQYSNGDVTMTENCDLIECDVMSQCVESYNVLSASGCNSESDLMSRSALLCDVTETRMQHRYGVPCRNRTHAVMSN